MRSDWSTMFEVIARVCVLNIAVSKNCACQIIACSNMESAIAKAALRLGFESLKSQQQTAILRFLEGNDVFVSLPTGSGKSLCFDPLLLVFDEVFHTKSNIAIVVSPLISLMQDQVSLLLSFIICP